MVGELLEFPGGIQGMALNLEEDNVGAVLLGSEDRHPRRRHSQAYRQDYSDSRRRSTGRPGRERAGPAD